MSWLTGATTWGALDSTLAQLICGEIADGNGRTNATPWLREVSRTVTDLVTTLNSPTASSASANFTTADQGSLVIATGVPLGTTIGTVTNATTVQLSANATATSAGVSAQIATNTIRTPASKDVASGAMSNRTGYFALLGGPNTNTMASGQSSIARVTTPYTTDPSTSGFHRWVVRLTVNTANTVAGTYSTASIGYVVYDVDSNAQLSNTSTAPTAGGVITLPNGLQVTLSDPSGILPVSTQWVRAFTGTYLYGIDYWPMLYRASTTPTFSAAPPGAAGTDYDIVSIAYNTQSFVGGTVAERGNLFHGLGIKTATANTGALYTVSWSMALIKCRIFNGATAGTLSLDVGQSKKDAVNSVATFRNVGGLRLTTWAKAWTTAASVTAASAVQYFLSVTADGIVLALNADPAQTGKLGTAFIAAFTPTDATYDVFPVAFNPTVIDYSTDTNGNDFAVATQYPYFSLRRRQDGSEGTRDWQTKWMRAEHAYISAAINYSGMSYQDIVASAVNATTGQSTSAPQLSAIGASSTANVQSYLPPRQNKPSLDGKWWLYGFQYGEGTWQVNSTIDENHQVRGQQSTRYFFVPETGWASGDELTDTSTGIKYLLVTPDFAALPRPRVTTNSFFGGMAIAEL